MELYLIKTLEKENMKREIYEIGGYKVHVDYFAGQFNNMWIETSHEEFKPSISFVDHLFKDQAPELKIQTTSYGALGPEEIQQVVKGYQVALDVVDILSKLFL